MNPAKTPPPTVKYSHHYEQVETLDDPKNKNAAPADSQDTSFRGRCCRFLETTPGKLTAGILILAGVGIIGTVIAIPAALAGRSASLTLARPTPGLSPDNTTQTLPAPMMPMMPEGSVQTPSDHDTAIDCTQQSPRCYGQDPVACTTTSQPATQQFTGEFNNGRDRIHEGNGTFTITQNCFQFKGEITGRYAYALYLSPTPVTSDDAFLTNCSRMARVGCVSESHDFSLPIPDDVDPNLYTHAVVWCEAARLWVTSGQYQEHVKQA